MSIIDTALNAKTDDERLIVMKGPLSELIYQELNKVYEKKGELEAENLSLETIAQDELILEKANQNDHAGSQDERPSYVVFGINAVDVDPESIVEVKNILKDSKSGDAPMILFTNKDSEYSKELADTAPASNLNGSYSAMTKALEEYALEHGAVVVNYPVDLYKLILR